METIGRTEIWSYVNSKPEPRRATNFQVRRGDGCEVRSFLDLATKVAELQFRNRDHVLLFRGQGGDYRNRNYNTSLKPTLLRPAGRSPRNPNAKLLTRRFQILQEAETALVQHYAAAKLLGLARLKRQRILRWAILQHYEVCKTPLLDVTHSLRIAASFASIGADRQAFLFVLGVPNLSGAITASAESGLQILRLSSVCPPSAVRPHIQEGYLLGQYPEISDSQQRENYEHYETDFGRRLVAKFFFDPAVFWKSQAMFPLVKKKALYPDSSDPIFALAEQVKTSIKATED